MQHEEWIDEWKSNWVARHLMQSRHPATFWSDIADRLIKSRQSLKNNPLVPIGRYETDWPGALELLVKRNSQGIALEKSRKIEAAIGVYELNVGDEFTGTHPYDRLRIIYTKRHWYGDAVRVCETYVEVLNRLKKTWPGYPNIQFINKYQEQAERLKAKNVNH